MAHPFQREQDPRKAALPQPFGATFGQAQAYCNFVVLQPDRFPGGTRLIGPSVRPAGDRFPTLRFVLGGPGLRLRVKEFLMDWNPTESAPNLAVKERAFVSHGTVGWIGRDAHGRRAFVHARWRTVVEAAVLQGEIGDEEVVEFFHGLKPARPEAPAVFHSVPYAELGWFLSRGLAPCADPRRARQCRWVALDEARAAFGRPLPLPEPLPAGYRVDSVGVAMAEPGGAAPQGAVVDVLLRHVGNGTDVIWCRAWPRRDGAPGGMPGDGPEDPWPGGAVGEWLELEGRRVWLADESPEYGGRLAAWQDDAHVVEFRARAGITLPRAAFLRAVRSALRRG